MGEFRGYGAIAGTTVLIQLFSVGFCVMSGSTDVLTVRKPHAVMTSVSSRGGCACPVDRCTVRKNDIFRSSLTGFLSPVLARSIDEKQLARSLETGGTTAMSQGTRIDRNRKPTGHDLNAQELAERIRRAEQRIELAKRIIAEQELSSRLEHLELRRKRASRSGS
jgi:hypothetical protein